MTTDHPHRRVVTTASATLDTIRTEVTTDIPDLETGGVLLGHPATPPANLHISIARDPGPRAVHEPRRFLRDSEHAQRLADTAWSDHGAVWIGEWHTHPAAGPEPSDIDLHAYLRHLDDPELAFEEFLSLIVAGTPSGPALVAWILNRTTLTQAQLELADQHKLNSERDPS